MLTKLISVTSAHPEVLHDEVQYVDQLWYSVSLLHDDFASPVRQHLVAVLHAGGNSWSEDGHRLSHDGPSLHGVGLQQAVEDLNRGEVMSFCYHSIIYMLCSIDAYRYIFKRLNKTFIRNRMWNTTWKGIGKLK